MPWPQQVRGGGRGCGCGRRSLHVQARAGAGADDAGAHGLVVKGGRLDLQRSSRGRAHINRGEHAAIISEPCPDLPEGRAPAPQACLLAAAGALARGLSGRGTCMPCCAACEVLSSRAWLRTLARSFTSRTSGPVVPSGMLNVVAKSAAPPTVPAWYKLTVQLMAA